MDWQRVLWGESRATLEKSKKESLFSYTDNYLKVMILMREGHRIVLQEIRIKEATRILYWQILSGEIRF